MSATLHHRAGIVVDFNPPPIPLRQYDYVATRERYEPCDAAGHGATEQQAIAQLIEQEQIDRCECEACEGSGRIPYGSFGAYYRDGEAYDAPGLSVCEVCDGVGTVDEAEA